VNAQRSVGKTPQYRPGYSPGGKGIFGGIEMKRFVAILLLVATVFGLIAPISGCSAQENQTLNMGQWLTLVNNAFGMESYTEETPYFAGIGRNHPFFAAVQIAAEWEVVDTNQALDVTKTLTWGEALITLVNVGGFLPVETSDEEKLEFAITQFDSSIRSYWKNREIPYANATVLLAEAQKQWAQVQYDENIEKIEYKEEVVDLTETVAGNYTVDASGAILLPEAAAKEIQTGEIYMIADKENPLEYTYYRAESVTTVDGVTSIVNSQEELGLEDLVDDIHIQGTTEVTADNTVIYDGNGNLIYGAGVVNQAAAGMGTASVVPLGATNLASGKVTHKFETDDFTISLSYNLNGALDMEVEEESADILPDKAPGEMKAKGKFAVNNLEIKKDFDYGVFKGLKHALLKVDYETEVGFGVGYEAKPVNAVKAPAYSNGNGSFLTNLKRSVWKLRDGEGNVSGAETIATQKVVKICSLNVYDAVVAKVCLDVNFIIKIDGSFEVTVTQSGTTGVEYKNGNLRFIKDSKKDANAELKAKLEATIGFGPALYIKGLKKKIVGLEVRMGLGAEGSVTWHLADSAFHLIEEVNFSDTPPEIVDFVGDMDIEADADTIKAVAEAQGGIFSGEAGVAVRLKVHSCFNISVYGILTVGLSDESYVMEFIGAKVKTTCAILSSKNATFFNYHVDDWNWGAGVVRWGLGLNSDDVCTLKFQPFDKIDETTAPTEETTVPTEGTTGGNDIPGGDFIMLTDLRADVDVKKTYCISFSHLPVGYSQKDLVFESGDKSVATVDSTGVVTGVAEGSTTVMIRTKDGKYTAAIAISVHADSKVSFEGVTV